MSEENLEITDFAKSGIEESMEEIAAMLTVARGDLSKLLSGNKAAGRRFRKAGRQIKKQIHQLLQDSLEYEKSLTKD